MTHRGEKPRLGQIGLLGRLLRGGERLDGAPEFGDVGERDQDFLVGRFGVMDRRRCNSQHAPPERRRVDLDLVSLIFLVSGFDMLEKRAHRRRVEVMGVGVGQLASQCVRRLSAEEAIERVACADDPQLLVDNDERFADRTDHRLST